MIRRRESFTVALRPVLPDLVGPDLDILFCGTAPGSVSAAKLAYYAGPGNAFWPTLFTVGLTPVAMSPHEYGQLARYRLGLTDLAKHVSGSDAGLVSAHFDVERLGDLIVNQRPRIVAFTSKRAAQEFHGGAVGYGLLPGTVAASRMFVLPSPSGAARRYWDLEPWRQLKKLRDALRPNWTQVGCGE